jgi:hypothetical protein
MPRCDWDTLKNSLLGGKMIYDCPKCGKPQSAFDDDFCGACEAEYQEETFRWNEEEKAMLQAEMQDCACHGDEPCQNCYRRLARLMELAGRYEEAIAWLNH